MIRPRIQILMAAAAITPALAFWRMECRGVAGYYRIDPLVSPGEPSMHLHAIMGSGAFGESATNAEITAANCTSCLVTQDKSSYWHPALYFLDSTTNEYELVEQVGGTLAYYLLNTGNGNTNITAFPEGFRMIAGDNTRRSFTAGNVEMVDPPKSNWAALNQTTQDKLAQRALGFNCLDYSITPEASLYRHFFPDKNYLDANCPDGIRFELMFPSCWNGVDVDSANHQSHVAYPDLVMQGDCPDDFPVRLPSLFYETIWNTPAYTSRTGQFVISNGDVQGFSYHGDFMMGWDPAFLQEAVDTCTNPSGLIGDCPLFTIQTLDEADSCKVAAPANLAADNATGPASSLPGNIAPYGDLIGATMIATYNPAISAQPDATAGIDGSYGAGSVAAAAGSTATAAAPSVPSTLVSVASSPPAAATTSSSAAAAVPTGFKNQALPVVQSSSDTGIHGNFVSTDYITGADGAVTEVLWDETTLYVTEELAPSTVTTTVAETDAAVPVKGRYVPLHIRNLLNRDARHQRQ